MAAMTNLGIDGIGDGVEIGRGGNAVVFRATQLDLHREVAVKMLQIGHDDGARRRFDRERQLMAKLQHRNIAPVLGSGYTSDGEPYLIMALYSTALDDLDPVPWSRCVDIMGQVAAAVTYAHDNGVLHRDLKPANIMLDGDRPVVLDFGIATLSDAMGTRSLALRLTPAFAPPEAFEVHEPSASLDVYALGATTHALLTGRPPFSADADGGRDGGLWAMIERVQTEAPADLRGTVPASVCAVIERSMAKTPGDRHSTAAAFAQDLASAVSPETVLVEAPRDLQIERDPTWAERSPRRRTALGAGVLIVVAVAALLAIVATRDRPPPIVEIVEAAGTRATRATEPTVAPSEPTPESAVERSPTSAPAPTTRVAPTPDAVDLIAVGLAMAMEYVGVDGAAPAKEQTCPGVLGWCIGDDVADIEAALGPKTPLRPLSNQPEQFEFRSWALPSNNTFTVGSDAAGQVLSLAMTRADGARVSLFGDTDLGVLTVDDVAGRFGEKEAVDGLSSSTLFHCLDAPQSLQVAYESLESPTDASLLGRIVSYRVFFEPTRDRFSEFDIDTSQTVPACPTT